LYDHHLFKICTAALANFYQVRTIRGDSIILATTGCMAVWKTAHPGASSDAQSTPASPFALEFALASPWLCGWKYCIGWSVSKTTCSWYV